MLEILVLMAHLPGPFYSGTLENYGTHKKYGVSYANVS